MAEECALKVASDRGRVSIPDVALVKGNSMALEDFTNLFLEAKSFVVLGLVEDVGGNGFHV